MELPVQLCRTRNIGEFEGISEPEMRLMECRGVLIAQSVHSVSASGGRTLVGVLNPSNAPITLYQDEKLGVLQPLRNPWYLQPWKKLIHILSPIVKKQNKL